MKKNVFLIFAFSMMMMQSIPAEPFLFGDPNEAHLVVNNRILAKVNGKVISVIDLMKKMDMLFYRQFPEYTSSLQARYQFYQSNWKSVLQEFIDKELVVADAEENKLIVTAGDVRREMESLFGPNIITNLDKVGLTFDEALKMVQTDIMLRRMLFFRVHSKAMRQVTPQVVRNYYEQFAKENVRDKEWSYRVISIRGKNATKAAEIANLARHLLSEEAVAFEDLPEKLKGQSHPSKMPTVNISEEYNHTDKELSDQFRDILSNQEPGTYSQPMAQKSRTDNSTVFRIFYLKSMSPGGVIPFNETENQIRNKLIEEASEKEMDLYLTKLRKHFDVQESQLKELVAEDFEPFALK